MQAGTTLFSNASGNTNSNIHLECAGTGRPASDHATELTLRTKIL